MSADILGTSCDQCRSMVQYSFTSTETRRLVRTDSPGRPPRLSHSSWTMVVTTQTTHVISSTAHNAYARTIVRNETELVFYLTGERTQRLRACFEAMSLQQSNYYSNFNKSVLQRALTSWAYWGDFGRQMSSEIRSAPPMAWPIITLRHSFDAVGRKARLRLCFAAGELTIHTPSIAFRQLPENSARFGYATEGALFISVQLSTDAVSALSK